MEETFGGKPYSLSERYEGENRRTGYRERESKQRVVHCGSQSVVSQV